MKRKEISYVVCSILYVKSVNFWVHFISIGWTIKSNHDRCCELRNLLFIPKKRIELIYFSNFEHAEYFRVLLYLCFSRTYIYLLSDFFYYMHLQIFTLMFCIVFIDNCISYRLSSYWEIRANWWEKKKIFIILSKWYYIKIVMSITLNIFLSKRSNTWFIN